MKRRPSYIFRGVQGRQRPLRKEVWDCVVSVTREISFWGSYGGVTNSLLYFKTYSQIYDWIGHF